MKATNTQHWVIASLIIGIIYYLYLLFFYPGSPVYNPYARIAALIFGIGLIIYPLIYWLLPKAVNVRREQHYNFMKENRLIKINEYLLFAIIGLITLVFSVKYYKTPRDVWWMVGVTLLIATFILFIQYHRGIIKLIRSNFKK